ncbi:MAG: RdgB/HAM1 family non-canonical purine NTP pyrophosphatase [Oscillospiraceae bacterium]|jgi:non-canonical purine NTP pyrophosphatase (RdgB/HAM1 family)|nr:RdgB/HAM1 family non-canonical purine NTP pyrophosphatase [Oscillospiraceae bacterium]
MRFVLSSNNKGKLEEISKILTPLGINVCTLKDLGIEMQEPEETGKTFKENAKIKALAAYNLTGLPTIADDSGLEVDALGGKPGIYSARFAGENVSEQENAEKLLSELKNVPAPKRTARHVCCICCILPGGKEFFADGIINGSIALEQRGDQGFGYDSIFIFDTARTFAQIPIELKNKMSHRAKAINNLYNKLKSYINSGEV